MKDDLKSALNGMPNYGYVIRPDNGGEPCAVVIGESFGEGYVSKNTNVRIMDIYPKIEELFGMSRRTREQDEMLEGLLEKMIAICKYREDPTKTPSDQRFFLDGLSSGERKQVIQQARRFRKFFLTPR